MKKRGVGMGCMFYGVGNTGMSNPAGAFIEMHYDGTATLLTGCADIGQGSNTVLAQIVAETLGIHYTDVFVTSAHTGVTPESGATSASRQTYISGNACKNAAMEARKKLVEVAADMLDVNKEEVVLKDQKAFSINDENKYFDLNEVLINCKKRGILAIGAGTFNPDTTPPSPEAMEGNPYATYAFGTQIVEVEVDTETGDVKVLKVIAAHDVGKAINKELVKAQLEGGCLMGAGFGLLEELEVSENASIINPNFSKYLIYTAKDMPEIYPFIVEDEEPTGPYGAKGVGEPALIPTAPAIANAIYDAIGIRFNELPVTQDKIVEKIKKEGIK